MKPPSECKKCGAEILWAETKRGKRMPVDAEPTPGGNVELHEFRGELLAHVHNARSIAAARQRAELHTSHFQTCTHAETFRS